MTSLKKLVFLVLLPISLLLSLLSGCLNTEGTPSNITPRHIETYKEIVALEEDFVNIVNLESSDIEKLPELLSLAKELNNFCEGLVDDCSDKLEEPGTKELLVLSELGLALDLVVISWIGYVYDFGKTKSDLEEASNAYREKKAELKERYLPYE